MKKIGSILLVLTLWLGSVAWADTAAVKDAGNKYCPVGLEQVSGKDFVEYEGVRYGLCCPMCAKKFLADPANYLAQLAVKEGQDARNAAKAQGDMEKAKTM